MASPMAKRSGGDDTEQSKRVKPDVHYHTSGPLDEVFGQHSAFPLDDVHTAEDVSVYEYLFSVRREAEHDRACYFVDRGQGSEIFLPQKTSSSAQSDSSAASLSLSFIQSTLAQLHREKQAYVDEKNKQQGEISEGVTLNWTQFDVESLESSSEDDDEVSQIREETSESAVEQTKANNVVEDDDEGGDSIRDYRDMGQPEYMGTKAYLVPESAGKWRELVFNNAAPPQTYFHDVLEHATVIKLIVYYTKWLSQSMPSTLAEWIFATFVRLDNGLDFQELAIVRELGKKALKIRQKLKGEEGEKVPVATECVDSILAVVSEYYGQRDLVERVDCETHDTQNLDRKD